MYGYTESLSVKTKYAIDTLFSHVHGIHLSLITITMAILVTMRSTVLSFYETGSGSFKKAYSEFGR